VQLREVQRAVLGVARLEVGCLCEVRQLALRRLPTATLLELRRAGTQVGRDGLPARGEHAHHLPGDALDLKTVTVIPRRPATPNRRVSASSRCWDTIAATTPMCSLYPRESGA